MFCKYGPAGVDAHVQDHRFGLVYEALIFQRVLCRLPVSAPRCFGTYADPSGWMCLFLEYVRGAKRINKLPTQEGLVRAAEWIGSFHALCDADAGSGRLGLCVHSAAYYRDWLARTGRLAAELPKADVWVADVCRRAQSRLVPLLMSARPTIVHGEYYPHNILALNGSVFPIDWETAAVAAGELDLASLTDGWPTDVVAECREIYASTRWGSATPRDFQQRLAACELYWSLRWLGRALGHAESDAARARLEHIERMAAEFSLL